MTYSSSQVRTRRTAAALLVVASAFSLASCGSEPRNAPQAAPAAEQQAAEFDSQAVLLKVGDKEFSANKTIVDKYQAVAKTDGAVGNPEADVVDGPDGGVSMRFTNGTIYASPKTPASVVRGAILKTYLDNDGAAGELGYPTQDETTEGQRTYSRFENGEIRLENKAITVAMYG